VEYPSLARTKTLKNFERFSNEVARATDNPDANAVHDLRVSIRRLSQALDVFDGAVPARVRKKLEKRAGSILRAAGDVRDLDIARELIGDGARDGLAAELEADRANAAGRLQRRLAKSAPSAELTAWAAAITLPDHTGEAADKARSVLADSAAQLLRAGDREIGQRATPKRYHHVRLAAKRLRYQVELFREIAPKQADVLLKSVAKLQGVLGDLNDSVTARKLLRDYSGTKDARRAVKRKQEKLLERAHEVWEESFAGVKSPEELLGFLDAKRPARKAV